MLLEWSDGEGTREWVDMKSFQAVYFEKTLLWARRVLASEQRSAVAWPSKVCVCELKQKIENVECVNSLMMSMMLLCSGLLSLVHHCYNC